MEAELALHICRRAGRRLQRQVDAIIDPIPELFCLMARSPSPELARVLGYCLVVAQINRDYLDDPMSPEFLEGSLLIERLLQHGAALLLSRDTII